MLINSPNVQLISLRERFDREAIKESADKGDRGEREGALYNQLREVREIHIDTRFARFSEDAV